LCRRRDVRSDLPAGFAHPMSATRHHALRALPGFRPTLAFTLAYLTVLVLMPLSGIPLHASTVGWETLWGTASDPRVIASFQLSLMVSFAAAVINGAL